MFAPSDNYRRKKFQEVCIPSNHELFDRYGQNLVLQGSNDGTDFNESESSLRLSKVEMIAKAREYAAQSADPE